MILFLSGEPIKTAEFLNYQRLQKGSLSVQNNELLKILTVLQFHTYINGTRLKAIIQQPCKLVPGSIRSGFIGEKDDETESGS